MQDNDLIMNCRNSVAEGFGPGKNTEWALKTDNQHVYRVIGASQLIDIIKSGYVKPKGDGKRSEKVGNVVYWSIGNDSLYYIDKRPVLEASIDTVKNNQIGAISINDLSAIYFFDEDKEIYLNYIEYFKELYNFFNREAKSLKR